MKGPIKVFKEPIKEDIEIDDSSVEEEGEASMHNLERTGKKNSTSEDGTVIDRDIMSSNEDRSDNDENSGNDDSDSDVENEYRKGATGDGNGMLNVIDKILSQNVSGKNTVLPHRKTKLVKEREAEQLRRKTEEK